MICYAYLADDNTVKLTRKVKHTPYKEINIVIAYILTFSNLSMQKHDLSESLVVKIKSRGWVFVNNLNKT